jgi:hypothetical protein
MSANFRPKPASTVAGSFTVTWSLSRPIALTLRMLIDCQRLIDCRRWAVVREAAQLGHFPQPDAATAPVGHVAH